MIEDDQMGILGDQYQNVLGIDPSTKTGLVHFQGETISTMVLRNEKAKGIQRVQWIAQNFQQYLHARQVDMAVIEGYAFGNQHTLATLVEIGVVLRLSLLSAKIPCYICPPSVLKKFATGKGNSKKVDVALAVQEKWGFENPSDDVVDAYVLAKIAQKIASGAQVTGLELLL